MWFPLSSSPFIFVVINALFIFAEAEKILLVNNTSACGPQKPQLVSLKFGFLTSPNYDNFRYYPPEQNCSWVLQAAAAQCTKNQLQCRHLTKCVNKNKVCDGIDDCKDGTDEENCNRIPLPAKCGVPEISPALGNDRIVGGRDAKPGSWPWQVSLRRLDRVPYSHMCGAVLINTQWLLTAAHCFKKSLDVKLWNALMGKHFKLVPDETEEIRYLESIHVHPKYKGFEAKLSAPWLVRKQHDIALVKLNAPVSVNAYVSPVCLPDIYRELSPGTICYVTGWGDTYDSGFELVLKQAAIPIVSRSTCTEMHRFYPIAETMLCAGYSAGGHDSCQGDSGGPLVFHENEKWKLAGIVSTGGSICAEKNQPGIYTSVPYYIDWVNDVITKYQNKKN